MIALTGASGRVGHFLLNGLPGPVVTLGRHPIPRFAHRPWDLRGPAPDLAGVTTLVHAAFSHVPGRYRGGEGDDPDGFLQANLDGSRRLFDSALRSGVDHIVFLSSRAVFDGLTEDTPLTETTPPHPASLYGRVKAQAEAHLAALPLTGQSLRATGLYGPGPHHKWQSLFRDYRAGHPIAPRRGTELHSADLAQAVCLLLNSARTGAFHASDLLLDRHDLLTHVQRLTACPHPPPARSDRAVNPLLCQRLSSMGWRPGGLPRLHDSLPALLAKG